MITLNVFFNVDVAKRDAFLTVLNNMVTESNKEAGCQFYELWQNPNEKDHYALIERWEDKDSLARHQKTAHWIAFNDVVNTFLTTPYDEHHYHEIAR